MRCIGELDNYTEDPFRKERKMFWTDGDKERKIDLPLVQKKKYKDITMV